MLFFNRRRNKFPDSFFPPYNKGGRKKVIALILIIFLLFSAIYISRRLGQLMIKIAEWDINNLVDILANDAINEAIDELDAQYDDIITISSDSQGNVTSINTNMAYANKLKTHVINKIYEILPSVESQVIEIPLGNLFGSKLFSGTGPYIPVKIMSVTNVNSSLENEFISVGINQTMHKIYIDATIDLSVMVPGYESVVSVSTTVLIAETVIVGKVPDTYIDFN